MSRVPRWSVGRVSVSTLTGQPSPRHQPVVDVRHFSEAARSPPALGTSHASHWPFTARSPTLPRRTAVVTWPRPVRRKNARRDKGRAERLCPTCVPPGVGDANWGRRRWRYDGGGQNVGQSSRHRPPEA